MVLLAVALGALLSPAAPGIADAPAVAVAAPSADPDIQTLAGDLRGKVEGGAAIGGVVRIDVGADYVVVDGRTGTNTVLVNRGGDKPSAAINLGAKHTQQWLAGTLSLGDELRAGRIAVEGDMGVALTLDGVVRGPAPTKPPAK